MTCITIFIKVGTVIISYTYDTYLYITHEPVIPNLFLFFTYDDGKCEKQPLFDLLLRPNCLREDQDQCAKRISSWTDSQVCLSTQSIEAVNRL